MEAAADAAAAAFTVALSGDCVARGLAMAMKDRNIEASTKVNAVVPRVPNFISTTNGMLPLDSFDDEMLKRIGHQWTQSLIERAAQMRSNRKKLA